MQELRAQLQAQLKLADHLRKLGEQGGISEVSLKVGILQRGCCIRSLLVTKFFEVVLLHEDITQRDLKNSSPWYTCGLGPPQVLAMSVHYF